MLIVGQQSGESNLSCAMHRFVPVGVQNVNLKTKKTKTKWKIIRCANIQSDQSPTPLGGSFSPHDLVYFEHVLETHAAKVGALFPFHSRLELRASNNA